MPNQHRHAAMALRDMLYQRLVNADKPVPMGDLHAMAERNGFTLSDAQEALHKLAEQSLVVYLADPTAVSVMAVEVADD